MVILQKMKQVTNAIRLHVEIAFGAKDSSHARRHNLAEHHQLDGCAIFVYEDKILGVFVFLHDEVVGLESGAAECLWALTIKMLCEIFIEFFFDFGIAQTVLA